jgi:hypothetical protein
MPLSLPLQPTLAMTFGCPDVSFNLFRRLPADVHYKNAFRVQNIFSRRRYGKPMAFGPILYLYTYWWRWLKRSIMYRQEKTRPATPGT